MHLAPITQLDLTEPQRLSNRGEKLPSAARGKDHSSARIETPAILHTHDPRAMRCRLRQIDHLILRSRFDFREHRRAQPEHLCIQGEAHSCAHRRERSKARVRCTRCWALLRQAHQRTVGVPRTDPSHAKGQTGCRLRRRHRDRAEVHQVRKIGIVAQLRIRADRIRVKIGQRGKPSRSRRDDGFARSDQTDSEARFRSASR